MLIGKGRWPCPRGTGRRQQLPRVRGQARPLAAHLIGDLLGWNRTPAVSQNVRDCSAARGITERRPWVTVYAARPRSPPGPGSVQGAPITSPAPSLKTHAGIAGCRARTRGTGLPETTTPERYALRSDGCNRLQRHLSSGSCVCQRHVNVMGAGRRRRGTYVWLPQVAGVTPPTPGWEGACSGSGLRDRHAPTIDLRGQIGRASCRERV